MTGVDDSPSSRDRDKTATIARRRGGYPNQMYLEVADEPNRRFVCEGTWTVGTSHAAKFQLNDPYISGIHLKCARIPGGVWIEDADSKNGTRLNGIEIQSGLVTPGMCITMGRKRLWLSHPASVSRGASTAREHTAAAPNWSSRLVGTSPVFRESIHRIPAFASLPHPVLILGETGTGKEVVARELHDAGSRRDGPFVALNCGAIPEQLAESELFGHERGSFTTAVRRHLGAFARARNGTLFLDEIGELSLPLQAKLLRVLESRAFNMVGGESAHPFEGRVLAATHRDLIAAVRAHAFREDLYHRLSVFQIRLPPLRDRREDLPALIAHLAEGVGRDLERPLELRPCAYAAAARHDWPGNVRALRNALVRAAVLGDGVVRGDLLVPAPDPATDAVDGITIPKGDYRSMKQALLRALVAEHGSIRRAARAINVPRSTLSAWLREVR